MNKADSTPDPAVILKVHRAEDPPGRASFFPARKSMATRLARDAQQSEDTVQDLGAALQLCQPASHAEFTATEMILIGIAQDGRWVRWMPTWAPVEPVPQSPGHTASQN